MIFLDTGILVVALLKENPTHFAHTAPDLEILTP